MRRRLNLLEKRQDSEDHYATVSDCAITLGVVARKEDIHIYSTGAEKQKLSDKTVIIEPRDDGKETFFYNVFLKLEFYELAF